jgi:hypothetical protein
LPDQVKVEQQKLRFVQALVLQGAADVFSGS